jgi:hypothetical protein
MGFSPGAKIDYTREVPLFEGAARSLQRKLLDTPFIDAR